MMFVFKMNICHYHKAFHGFHVNKKSDPWKQTKSVSLMETCWWRDGREGGDREEGGWVGGGGEGPSVSPGKAGKWSMPSGNCHSVLFKG